MVAEGLRRTNELVFNPAQGIVTKFYRNAPLAVVGQVACEVRPLRALRGKYRCETEQIKTTILREAGFPLALEYLYFVRSGVDRPFAVIKYDPDLLNAEEYIRRGLTLDQACLISNQCANLLYRLHTEFRNKDQTVFTHGDPYLENFDVSQGEPRLYDFEHEHSCHNVNPVLMDQLFFFWHSFNVLSECGHIKSTADFGNFRDAIHAGYPNLDTRLEGLPFFPRLYFNLRFKHDQK